MNSIWDFNHDIVVLTGANAQEFIRALTDRGQLRIVVVSEQIAEVHCSIERVVAWEQGREAPKPDATIVTIGGSLPLTEDQVATLTDSSFISPNYLQVATGPSDHSSATFEKIVGRGQGIHIAGVAMQLAHHFCREFC